MDNRSLDVENILDHFDFEKVHAYMRISKWTYRGEGLPSLNEIKGTARMLVEKAIYSEEENYSTGTGGFWVFKYEYGIKLIFAIDTSSNY